MSKLPEPGWNMPHGVRDSDIDGREPCRYCDGECANCSDREKSHELGGASEDCQFEPAGICDACAREIRDEERYDRDRDE